MRAGIEKLLSKISADPDFPSDEINKLISSFAELREQINKTIQMLEKLELYESRSKKRKK
jgi:HAMP domain-containing protein